MCPLSLAVGTVPGFSRVFSPVVSPVAGTILPSGSTVINSCGSAAKLLCNFVCDCSDCSDENQCGGYPAPTIPQPHSQALLLGQEQAMERGALWVQAPGRRCWCQGWVQIPRVGAGPPAGRRSLEWAQVPRVGRALP